MENTQSNPVGWFEIYVNHMPRAKKFYETVLQTTLEILVPPGEESDLEMYTFPSNMNIYGSGGALVYMEGFKAGGNSTVIYFSSDDCSLEESKIEIAGGSVFKSKMSIGEYGFIVLATDTEGNMFGVHSMK
ncbi:VOC family protein [Mariniflexile sp. AS56]|uniref:VOC family protein n=1 Tax=Mariniflexile sp. AS56 TaxID=3063957 RepID=UPI0026EFAE77|nr:VOC family protein [Mariniflexile sp. AS56]MDO7171147.1 VOC family protein [Mariniflexile sp. AS56]